MEIRNEERSGCETDEEDSYDKGDFVVFQYQRKMEIIYFVAVITDVNEEDELYQVSFYKCRGKKYFLFDQTDTDEIGIECIKGELPEPNFTQKLEAVYYYFDCSKYKICKFE